MSTTQISTDRPTVETTTGPVQGIWRGGSAAFYGIPFAEAPVGEHRFAAPVPRRPWDGVLDASAPGATPQRRPFGEVTTIPEPSFPGDSTLNVNVFTPAPGRPDANLPVLVWIHGGGFFAGSPSSPWYDGRSFNRDGVVTVSLSYRLGFDGFGWIADGPLNRGLLDQLAGLAWVQQNIAAFGGDPNRVTIAGQSAGGSSVMALLASPAAKGLFSRVISHSGANLAMTAQRAEKIGRDFAAGLGVEPTRAGWSQLSEDAILDAQAALTSMDEPPPASASAFVANVLAGRALNLAFVPAVGDEVLPFGVLEALQRGIGAEVDLLAGTVAHEFTMMTMGAREAWAGSDAVQSLADGGIAPEAATTYVAGHPELTSTADVCGQLITDFSFRIPTLTWADARPSSTWLYDFRWPTPLLGQSVHCLELPFAWDLLDADGVTQVTGPNPPASLAQTMHAAWVAFITTGNPGWAEWDGGNARVFGSDAVDSYRPEQSLAASLAVN
ncbi:MAG TPA: carboxylesterase family protein [Propionicimonas sp.]|nr:carboxylesterase family protein [Propionicimonas sp.]